MQFFKSMKHNTGGYLRKIVMENCNNKESQLIG